MDDRLLARSQEKIIDLDNQATAKISTMICVYMYTTNNYLGFSKFAACFACHYTGKQLFFIFVITLLCACHSQSVTVCVTVCVIGHEDDCTKSSALFRGQEVRYTSSKNGQEITNTYGDGWSNLLLTLPWLSVFSQL